MKDTEPDSQNQRGVFLVVDPDVAHSRSPEFARSLAVVIGINDYCHGIAPLRTAARDAEVLARILAEEHHYHVLHLLIHDVTLARLKTLFKDELCGEVSANDRVVVYFAGHGIALEGSDGPAGYLVPQDARPEDYSTFLPMHEFHDALMALDCRHMLIILDCCFAGAMRWSSTRALPILPPVIHQERYARFIRDRAWQVLTSAAYDQTALDVLKGSREEDNAGVTLEHSPFALALFEGLRGKGDVVPVEQKDGVITATELYLYLRDYVERRAEDIAGHLQTPGLWPLKKHEKGEYIFLSPNFSPDNLPPAPELNAGNNPYRGLKAFEEEHAALFFGRTALVKDLAGTVICQPLTVVLGASGTGKSSVVKAGLLPYLRGAEVRATRWHILPPMRPTESPLHELDYLLRHHLPDLGQVEASHATPRALTNLVTYWARTHPEQKLLLVIDQFEELVTLCRHDAEREQFFTLLNTLLNARPEQLRLILTLRSDFEPQFAGSALHVRWGTARFVIPPLNQTELREVIEGPASVRVLYFDPPELVDRLIEEVVQTPGALPLLSFTLSELYMKYIERQGDDRALSKADYDALGGVVGSLSSRATEEYEQLRDPASQATMQRVLLRMVASEGGELARRRVLRSELIYPDEAENARVTTVIKRLEEARLVVSDKTDEGAVYVEPAHDALVRAWDKLLTWHREAEDYLPLQRRLTQAAGEWAAEMDERTKTDLLWDEDPRLPQVEQVLAGNPETVKRGWVAQQWLRFCDLWRTTPLQAVEGHWLNQLELDFVRRSVEQRRKDGRRLVGTVAVVMVVLVTLTVFALFQANQANIERGNALNAQATAEAERDIAVSRQLAAQSINHLRDDNWELGVLLAIESGRRAKNETVEAFAALQQVFAYPAHTVFIHSGDYAWWSADGRLALIRNTIDDTLEVWDTIDKTLQVTLPITGDLLCAAFNPAGRHILTVNYQGEAIMWDIQTAQSAPIPFDQAKISQAAWNADGSRILIVGCNETNVHGDCIDSESRVWVLDTQTWKEQPAPPSHIEPIQSATWNADGNRILTVDYQQARIWDAHTGQEFFMPAQDAWLDPIGDRVLTVDTYPNNIKRVWNVTAQTELFTLTGDTDRIEYVTWSADGSRIIAVDSDNEVWSWDFSSAFLIGGAIVTGTRWTSLPDSYRTGFINTLTWNADNKRILVAGCERSDPSGWVGCFERPVVRVWDISSALNTGAETGTGFPTFFTGSEWPILHWSSDGKRLLVVVSNTLQIQDAFTGAVLSTLTLSETINQATLSDDNNRILIVSDYTVSVWDAYTNSKLLNLPGQTSGFRNAKWNRNESQIMTISTNEMVQVWDTDKQKELFSFPGQQAAWNQDESFILTTDWSGVQVWNAVTGDNMLFISEPTYLTTQAEWSSDSNRILTVGCLPSGGASGCGGGTTRVWSVSPARKTFEATGVELPYFPWGMSWHRSARWNADGNRILTIRDDVRIWDAQTGQKLLSLPGTWAEWDAKEDRILTITSVGVQIWELGSDSKTAKELLTLSSTKINDAMWGPNPNDNRILTRDDDGTLRQYYTRMADWLKAACQRAPRNLTREEWAQYLGDEPYRATCPNLPEAPADNTADNEL